RGTRLPVCRMRGALRHGSADEELARRLPGRPHRDVLVSLDAPAAGPREDDDVAFGRTRGKLLLVDRPAAVRKHELEAVTSGGVHRKGRRLPEERRVSLDVEERVSAALPLVVGLEAGQGAPAADEGTVERGSVHGGEFQVHA